MFQHPTHQTVVSARSLQRYGSIVDPELILFLQQRKRTLKKSVVLCVFNVYAHHLREKRRLRSVEIVATSAIRDKTNGLNQIQKILDDILRNLCERAFGPQ
jgi:exopolyphosphatase/pppGpp-phosphohydrolase